MSDEFQKKLFSILEERNQILKKILENREFGDSEKKELLAREYYWHDSDFLFSHLITQTEAINQKLNKLSECTGVRCRLGDENQESLSFLVAKTSEKSTQQARDEGLKEIRDFTKDAENLIVIDPYIYGGMTAKSKEYVQEFAKASRISSTQVRRIHIVFNSRMGNTRQIKQDIKNLASENGVRFTETDTDLIHDRIWIADRKRAIVVGTSLGGLGNRMAFILQLPRYDLNALLEYLDENGLIR
ncbi:hypothetical protein [Niallia sp. FSL R7-0271]|uniref:hypothetical protein n=1 Tax=Niallia sp. FSL R7-0271 TaxID=2921678 RepID=UPI0030F6909C